jgi:hypothetical protein
MALYRVATTFLLVATAGGCDAHGRLPVTDAASSAPVPTVSTTHAASSAPVPTVSTTQGGSPGFVRARREWRAGADVAAYREGAYWSRAALELASGLKTDAKASSSSGRDAYLRAIAALRRFASEPDTGVSPAGQAQDLRDLQALNAFFQTSALYM